jgi:hypothetical protein
MPSLALARTHWHARTHSLSFTLRRRGRRRRFLLLAVVVM